ncbi:ATP-dependent helicase BRM-like [Iris pallida]|uniref:ATP-dependent helicase BRM-like n=1 Tax=Iris pallida TaxID=29817 RepID=A0AAX6E6N6_IRIPA|nr:ATP-dependent helicase BRM-like [Iris pallida]
MIGLNQLALLELTLTMRCGGLRRTQCTRLRCLRTLIINVWSCAKFAIILYSTTLISMIIPKTLLSDPVESCGFLIEFL